MNKRKEKILLAALIGILNTNLFGCSNSDTEVINNDKYKEFTIGHDALEELSTEIKEDVDVISELIAEETKLIKSYNSVTATSNVNIRKSIIDGEIMGVLKNGSSLKLLSNLDNGWYKVEYYGEIGYVSKEYTIESISYNINREIKKVCYSTEDIILTPHESINNSENIIIPALTSIEVYEEIDNNLLVKSNGHIGYISKHNLLELNGIFVVVDITDQELKLYSNNEIILKTPVVTGKPSTPSDQGLFEIYDISTERYLVGPGYKSYVDIMMKYNRGEGLHDASYHTHEDGFKHGWRENREFGGETYLTNGSHGCINMLRDDVLKVSEYASLGTKVLVQE